MSGHSKWANIKHKKARADAKKGKIFSKIAKEIMVAARAGGGDPAANMTLRALLDKARSYNMPADNIERAVKKGTGEGSEDVVFEELVYEGYAAGGVAILIDVLTDNRNRSAAEVRNVFTKQGCNLGGVGSVAHLFQRRGQIFVDADQADEDRLMEVALEAGADDMQRDGDAFEILSPPTEFMNVSDAVTAAGFTVSNAELTFLADIEVPVNDAAQAKKLMRFLEALEDLDDVQNVYSNADIDDALLDDTE